MDHYEDIIPVWFCENLLFPAVGKRHPKKARDGNMEDNDGTNVNSKQPPTKKPQLQMATVKKSSKMTTITKTTTLESFDDSRQGGHADYGYQDSFKMGR